MSVFVFKKPPGTAGSSAPAIAVGCFVAFGGILYGYDTGTIGGILASPYWLEHFGTTTDPVSHKKVLTTNQESEIVSLLSVGTFFGSLFAAPTGDLLGRRLGLVAAAFVFTIGVILQTASTAIPLFIAGRVVAGFGVGMLSALVPLYQSETSPKWIRGTIVGAYQLAITIGLLLAAIVDNYTNSRNDSGAYRIPIAIQFAWAIIIVVGMLILPETPRYMIKKGDPEGAARSLSRLRRLDADHPALVEELAEITANHEYELSLGKSSYLDLFKGNVFKRLLTGCLLQSLQQLTGVNFIFYYGTAFFEAAGFTNGFHNSMITSGVNVGSTFPGLYLVETMGRRNLLLMGAIGMAIAQFVVAIVGTIVGTTNQTAQKVLIAFICIYIFFFACSWGPVAWVVTGEIFPLKVRAKGLSITTASNWLLNFAIGYATPYLVNNNPGSSVTQGVNLGAKVFFIWGGCCFICIFFVWAMIYETKGLSLEQVDELYAKVGKAWQSPGFVPTISFQEIQDVQGAGHANARHMSLSDIENVADRRRSGGGGVGVASGTDGAFNEKANVLEQRI